MKIEIVSKDYCKPLVPTHHLRSYKLSLLDQISSSFYVPLILLYSTPENINSPPYLIT